ncbi:MAG: hypothetical protein AAF183_13105 [Pseudomonadota bacterium]
MRIKILLILVLVVSLIPREGQTATFNNIIEDSFGNIIGIQNFQFNTLLESALFNVTFSDAGLESVSFNDVYGDGPYEFTALTREELGIAPNSQIASITNQINALLRLSVLNGDVTQSINTQNTGFVIPSTATDDTFFIGDLYSLTSGTTILAGARDVGRENVSFIILDRLAAPVGAVPLPASFFLLLMSLLATVALKSRPDNRVAKA